MRNAYLTYASKRLVQAAVVILLAYLLTFVVVSILPGDPITSVLRDPQNGFTEEQITAIIAAQGLDQPILVQLWASLSHFLIGDLGLSMRSTRPVATLLAEVLPSTLILASEGFLIALLLAVTIAYGSQFLPRRFGQGVLRAFPSLFLSVPNFVIGLVLIHAFGFQLGLFRVIEPDSVWATVFAAMALGIPISARIAEVLVANLDHESRQEYIAVARSRGLGQIRLFTKHLLKPSALPVVTVVALTIGELLGGSLITETVFGRTGIVMSFGRLLAYESLRRTNPRAGCGRYVDLGFGRCWSGQARRQYHALRLSVGASLRVPRAVDWTLLQAIKAVPSRFCGIKRKRCR